MYVRIRASDKEMAPAVVAHPEARTTDRKGGPVDSTSVARSAQESLEVVECFRHDGEECPRCEGSGFRPRKHCAGCGEPSGSISQGTGAPLVKDRRSGGHWYHVNCLPRIGAVPTLL